MQRRRRGGHDSSSDSESSTVTSRSRDRSVRHVCPTCARQFNSANALSGHQNKHRREREAHLERNGLENVRMVLGNLVHRHSGPTIVQPAEPPPPQPQWQAVPATVGVAAAGAHAGFLPDGMFGNGPAVAMQQPTSAIKINPVANTDGLGGRFHPYQRPMGRDMAAEDNKGKAKVAELETAVNGESPVPANSKGKEKVEDEQEDEDEGDNGLDLELRLGFKY